MHRIRIDSASAFAALSGRRQECPHQQPREYHGLACQTRTTWANYLCSKVCWAIGPIGTAGSRIKGGSSDPTTPHPNRSMQRALMRCAAKAHAEPTCIASRLRAPGLFSPLHILVSEFLRNRASDWLKTECSTSCRFRRCAPLRRTDSSNWPAASICSLTQLINNSAIKGDLLVASPSTPHDRYDRPSPARLQGIWDLTHRMS